MMENVSGNMSLILDFCIVEIKEGIKELSIGLLVISKRV